MMSAPEVRLFTFPGSNAAATAEMVLAHADVPYERVQLRPGLHAASLKLRGFPKLTVPALQVDDHKISGSRAIARHVAEQLAPDAGLLPTDPVLRARVLEAEREGERLQKAVRRLFYAAAAGSPVSVRNLVDANYTMLPSTARGLIVKALIPAAQYAHRARVEQGPDYVTRIVDLLQLADSYVAEGLIGDVEHPNIADFQFAPNVVALGEMAGDVGEFVRSHAVWAPMQQLLPEYPVAFHVEAPAEWFQGVT